MPNRLQQLQRHPPFEPCSGICLQDLLAPLLVSDLFNERLIVLLLLLLGLLLLLRLLQSLKLLRQGQQLVAWWSATGPGRHPLIPLH